MGIVAEISVIEWEELDSCALKMLVLGRVVDALHCYCGGGVGAETGEDDVCGLCGLFRNSVLLRITPQW